MIQQRLVTVVKQVPILESYEGIDINYDDITKIYKQEGWSIKQITSTTGAERFGNLLLTITLLLEANQSDEEFEASKHRAIIQRLKNGFANRHLNKDEVCEIINENPITISVFNGKGEWKISRVSTFFEQFGRIRKLRDRMVEEDEELTSRTYYTENHKYPNEKYSVSETFTITSIEPNVIRTLINNVKCDITDRNINDYVSKRERLCRFTHELTKEMWNTHHINTYDMKKIEIRGLDEPRITIIDMLDKEHSFAGAKEDMLEKIKDILPSLKEINELRKGSGNLFSKRRN